MNNSCPEIQRLAALWQKRLRESRLRYDFARNYVKEIQQDTQSGGIPSPDGNFAYNMALRQETFALATYRETLKIFTALVLDGKIPEETDWPLRVRDVEER